jgi:hypothetical protein
MPEQSRNVIITKIVEQLYENENWFINMLVQKNAKSTTIK